MQKILYMKYEILSAVRMRALDTLIETEEELARAREHIGKLNEHAIKHGRSSRFEVFQLRYARPGVYVAPNADEYYVGDECLSKDFDPFATVFTEAEKFYLEEHACRMENYALRCMYGGMSGGGYNT